MTPADPSPEIIVAELAERPAERAAGDEPFGVPRRFGIGTILVITTAFGLLLSLLQNAGAPPGVVWFVIVFVSLIGLGQMLLFGGSHPRKASIVTGEICFPLMIAAAVALFKPSRTLPGEMAWVVFTSLVFGGGFGYLAGGVVAGVFLIMDGVEQALASLNPRDRDERQPT